MARPFVVKKSPIHGKGVFATRRIPKGTRLIEYKGERISWEEADRRYDDSIQPHHTFLFAVDDKVVIDAGVRGNDARWINHSCDPNCEAVDEDGRIFIETIRDIEPGEELTYDYSYILDEPHTAAVRARYPCRCGSPKCRGTILGNKRRFRAQLAREERRLRAERRAARGGSRKGATKRRSAQGRGAAKRAGGRRSSSKRATANRSTSGRGATKRATTRRGGTKGSATNRSAGKRSTTRRSSTTRSAAKRTTTKRATTKRATTTRGTATRGTARRSTTKRGTTKRSATKRRA
ncbi:MAG TPA: SET domain-containing protein-lysine N-methyltransferase [Longimicrobiales bacterium]